MSGAFSFIGAQWHLRPDSTVLGRSRAAVERLLRAHRADQECVERSVLAADELLSNAIVHAHTASVLSVSTGRAGVRVAVTDGVQLDPSATWSRTPSSGGLWLVRQLSRRLYVVPQVDGKTVAAEIDRAQ